MSYNITSTITLRSTLTITRGNAEAILRDHKRRLPELHFLDPENIQLKPLRCPKGHHANGMFCATCGAKIDGLDEQISILEFWWYGICSGDLGQLATVAAFTSGEAEVVLVWERGDAVGGIKIKDGVVTEHEVTYAFGPASRTVEVEP